MTQPDIVAGENIGMSGLKEIFARMGRSPGRTAGLFAVTAVMSLLGLAVSLFVIQVLNRYVVHGVNGTLITLAVGAVLALATEHLLRRLRWRLAEEIAGERDRQLVASVFGLMLTARHREQAAWPPHQRLEILNALERSRQALGPTGLTVLADLPFSLLILTALYLMSPLLSGITAAFCAALALLAWLDQSAQTKPARALAQARTAMGALAAAAANADETVRCFNAHDAMMAQWRRLEAAANDLARYAGWTQLTGESLAQLTQGAMSVAVVSAGAVMAAGGELDVGTLVGANLIAARALQPFARAVRFGASLRAASSALTEARRFAVVETEPTTGRTLPEWRGGLRLDQLTFFHPGAEKPVIAGLSGDVVPGSAVAVVGRNGIGKSTLLRLFAGLETPGEGRILADDVDLRRVSLPWWRAAVSYLPQEPEFLPGTLRENLRYVRPAATEDELFACLRAADLQGFVDAHPRRLDMEIVNGGRALPPALRRRLGLARALVGGGRLVLLDEPSEGLDSDGRQTVYQRLIDLARGGRTLIIATHDEKIIAGASVVIDLNVGRFIFRSPGAGQ